MALSCVLLVLSRNEKGGLAVTPRVSAEGLPAGRPRGSEQGPGRRLQRARLWAQRRQGLLGAQLHPPTVTDVPYGSKWFKMGPLSA